MAVLSRRPKCAAARQVRVAGERVAGRHLHGSEVARVGWTEAEAREHLGDAIHVHKTPITNADRAVCDGERDGFIKLITSRRGKIVGATIVASRADEMIGEVALAMEQGLGVDAIAETIHAYLTWSTAIQLAAVDMMMARLEESRLFRLTQRWSGLRH